MLSVGILNMYAKDFESLVKLPKFSFKKKIKATKTLKPETQRTEHCMNGFTGSYSVLETDAGDDI